MASIREELKELKELNEMLKEVKKQKAAPERSLSDRVLGRKRSEKEFKLPRKLRPKKKKIKGNYVLTHYIYNNGNVEIFWSPITNDGIFINKTGNYHAADAEYILRYNKFPMIIIPEWSVTPISPSGKPISPEDTKPLPPHMMGDKNAVAAKLIINQLKAAQLGLKKGMSGKTWFFIIIAIVVVIGIIVQSLGGTP
jgi:hypothetical protein